MNSEFAEVIDEVEAEKEENDDVLQAGDECGKNGCEKKLYELNHERSGQTEITKTFPQDDDKDPVTISLKPDRHADAPETEIACIHHGVRRSC